MPATLRTRLAVLGVATSLGLACSACSRDDSADRAPASDSSSAPDTTPSDGEADLDTAAGEEIGAEQLVDLMQAAAERATTATLTVQLTAGGQDIEVTGEADYTTDPTSMRLDMSGLGSAGDLTMVLVDDVAYIRLLARSEDYVRVDLDDPANPLGGAFTGQLDPGAQAEVVAGGLRRATYVGEEVVRGESLEHYTAVVDPAAVLDQLDLGAAGAAALPEEITYDLWFDADGLYRQLGVDLGASAGEVLVRFEDWGTDVDIEAPPADRVSDLGSAAG